MVLIINHSSARMMRMSGSGEARETRLALPVPMELRANDNNRLDLTEFLSVLDSYVKIAGRPRYGRSAPIWESEKMLFLKKIGKLESLLKKVGPDRSTVGLTFKDFMLLLQRFLRA